MSLFVVGARTQGDLAAGIDDVIQRHLCNASGACNDVPARSLDENVAQGRFGTRKCRGQNPASRNRLSYHSRGTGLRIESDLVDADKAQTSGAGIDVALLRSHPDRSSIIGSDTRSVQFDVSIGDHGNISGRGGVDATGTVTRAEVSLGSDVDSSSGSDVHLA